MYAAAILIALTAAVAEQPQDPQARYDQALLAAAEEWVLASGVSTSNRAAVSRYEEAAPPDDTRSDTAPPDERYPAAEDAADTPLADDEHVPAQPLLSDEPSHEAREITIDFDAIISEMRPLADESEPAANEADAPRDEEPQDSPRADVEPPPAARFGADDPPAPPSNVIQLGATAADPYPPANAPAEDEQPWLPLLAVSVALAGSLGANLFLGWSYLDARRRLRLGAASR